MHHYFISYTFSQPSGAWGHGNIEIALKGKVSSMGTVRSMEKKIEEAAGVPGDYHVLNFILLKKSRA